MIVKVLTDLHLYAPNEIRNDQDTHGFDVILLGDIVDLSLCSKKDLSAAISYFKFLRKTYGKSYLLGNHERMGIVNETLVINKTLFAHGDIESNPEKWIKYRSKKPDGAGFIKRGLWSPSKEWVESWYEKPVRERFLKNASIIAKKNNCTHYVCGHFHPEKRIVTVYDGITITVLPRGYNDVIV